MYPNTGEWFEILLLLFGPLHVLGCVILTAIAWWLGPRWSMPLRISVLAVNVLLALGPVVTGLTVGKENRSVYRFGLGLAVCELLAVGGLAAVLIFRRPAVAPPR